MPSATIGRGTQLLTQSCIVLNITMSSKEGFQWTAATGLKSGLPCDGGIPPSKQVASGSHYDVIVVGAGFAGLVASRDLALRGQ